MGLLLAPGREVPPIPKQQTLTLAEPPPTNTGGKGRGENTFDFKGRRNPDRSRREAMNQQLGLAGELLVVRHEQRRLMQDERADLAERVRHVSVLEGDGAGYDILSFDKLGETKYIEVKTTIGPRESDFFVSAGEVAFSERHAERYHLYRVFNYSEVTDTGEFYVLGGPLTKLFRLVPTQFRARR